MLSFTLCIQWSSVCVFPSQREGNTPAKCMLGLGLGNLELVLALRQPAWHFCYPFLSVHRAWVSAPARQQWIEFLSLDSWIRFLLSSPACFLLPLRSKWFYAGNVLLKYAVWSSSFVWADVYFKHISGIIIPMLFLNNGIFIFCVSVNSSLESKLQKNEDSSYFLCGKLSTNFVICIPK